MRGSLDEGNDDNRTIYCGNLSENVTDSILFELFQQAGPVESVRRPKDPNGRPKTFGFILYKHECSVPYALEIFRGTKLFNRILNMNSRSNLRHVPVLDTHITELTEPRGPPGYEEVRVQEKESRRYQERDDNGRGRYRSDRNKEVFVQDFESRMYHNREDSRREQNRSDNHRRNNYHQDRHSHKEKDAKTSEPTSWAELNALRGKNAAYSSSRSDLQGSSDQSRGSNIMPQMMPDFNALLQMGQQMMISPGYLGMGGFPFPNSMGGLGPAIPDLMPGMMGSSRNAPERDNSRYSPERDRGRRDNHSRRESRRDHPYNDHGHQDHWDEYRRHDRGYSSSRSSHDRERRDRRSR